MWLDLLMLRLMNEGHTDKPPIWFALDEAADLQHVPQLAKAITQNRKSNNPMVLGFQGKDQVEIFYGRLAKTVLSQPSTRIYLKTGEPDAPNGSRERSVMVYVERLRETWSTGADGRNQLSETIDPPRSEPLISYSKIAGLIQAARLHEARQSGRPTQHALHSAPRPLGEVHQAPALC